ncbi:MAG: FG-GAP repeat domain-containing protein [Pseudonocardiaceae bacterium]
MVVLINRGDATFERGATYPTGLQPAQVVSADFNGDGLPDLAIASTVPAGNIVVLLNRGGGRFARSQTLTVGAAVLYMQVADVNGDHRPDLLVGDALRGITVLIGRGNGTFTTGTTVPLPIIEGFAVGDVNHDGIVDIAIPGFIRNTVSVFLGRGDGTFAPPIVSVVNPRPGVVPTFPISAVMADLNGDDAPDLAVSGGTDNTLYIMAGDGTGRFVTTESHPLQQMPRTIIADDVNRDGRSDLVVTELLGRTAILLHS